MSIKTAKAPYEAPDLRIDLMEPESIVCASWGDGTIPEDMFNNIGNL